MSYEKALPIDTILYFKITNCIIQTLEKEEKEKQERVKQEQDEDGNWYWIYGLGYQGDRIPFGTSGRKWNEIDEEALVTSVMSTDFNKYLLIDIDFSSEDDGLLQDISGNGNDARMYNDYRVDYEENTRIPERMDTQQKPQLNQNGKQF